MARALRVEKSVQVRSSPARMFQAITRRQDLALWFADRVSQDLAAGQLVEFGWGRGAAEHRQQARVLKIDPAHSVMLRWEDARAHSRDDYLSLTVEECAGGSLVTVLDFATKDTRDELEQIWDDCLAKLKKAFDGAAGTADGVRRSNSPAGGPARSRPRAPPRRPRQRD